MFADDTTIHSCLKQIEPLLSLVDLLQQSADELQSWTELNYMTLNLLKTEVMLITTQHKRQNLTAPFPKIHLSTKHLSEVQRCTILGVDNNLCWSQHILTISKTTAQKIFLLSRIKQSRQLFYTTYI